MSHINKVMLKGNLGADPELRYTSAGKAVANFSIATTSFWNDPTGTRQEKTEWHRLVLWGKQAEVADGLLKKGSQIFVEGSLKTREWIDREDNKRFTTEINVKSFDILNRVKSKD